MLISLQHTLLTKIQVLLVHTLVGRPLDGLVATSLLATAVFRFHLLIWIAACECVNCGVSTLIIGLGSAANRRANQQLQQQEQHLPGAHKVSPVVHNDLRETDFGFGIVASKVIETTDQRRTKDVGQVLAVNAALSLCE